MLIKYVKGDNKPPLNGRKFSEETCVFNVVSERLKCFLSARITSNNRVLSLKLKIFINTFLKV